MDAKPAQEATRSSQASTFPSLTAVLCIAILTVHTIVTATEARHDFWAVALVVFVYVLILLFFLCIYVADRMPIDSPARARLNLPIWVILSTMLLLAAYGTSAPLAWPAWVLSLLCSGLYFWVLFLGKAKR